jgi:hypothetical protein
VISRALVVAAMALVWFIFMDFAVGVAQTIHVYFFNEGLLIFLRDVDFLVFWLALLSVPTAWTIRWLRNSAERQRQATAARIFSRSEVGDAADGWHVSGAPQSQAQPASPPVMFSAPPPQQPTKPDQRRYISELARTRVRQR